MGLFQFLEPVVAATLSCRHAAPRALAVALTLTAAAGANAAKQDVQLDKLNLPDGFKIELYADDVPNARHMALGENGTLFVGSRRAGKVYAVIDRNGDHKADEVKVIAEGLKLPTGVAFKDGDLYVSAVTSILRFDNIESRLDNPPQPVVITDQFPDKHHGWKYIAFGPDGWLYVPIGAPCNICEEKDYANIQRLKIEGDEVVATETWAEGVRNTVGFTWHPQTDELWFTDNGRDMLGDDIPPCELNKAPRPGMHFGYPYCHGDDILDPEFGEGKQCSDFVRPVQNLGPHVAPLGVKFYTGDQFPAEYKNQVLIAEHGSWNRTNKIGYRVTMVTLNEDGEATSYAPFIDGWLQGEEAWGRPVDVLVMPDGALLVSDDGAGAIYRVTYEG
ncbi:sorbosone dehydrogenase family protein [Microbulbifer agarilyticus]|uniref:PQQ-dependent sugar dehydrogenase n=1 Tax=Microbulbifer agarilyticus TaxID=260552 RepID=UPI001C958D96|nr:sorbosone dehydrogenase family protein [Microbulbifer agarilyticus]MBY6211416.1 sorbosone dehydrogenase family protein [Microbulbifer agarilyticus]